MKSHTHSIPRPLNLVLISTALVGVITGFIPKAFAATFKVNNNNDSGAGSLRQAIIDAGRSPGLDIIDLTGVNGTIPLNNPLIVDAGNDIRFEGNGNITISGQRICQIMAINGAKVDISGITFADGFAKGGEGRNGGGGGLGAGGALFINAGVVKLNNNVKFIGNGASGGISVVESNFYNGGDYYYDGKDGGGGGKLNAGTCGGITFAASSSFPPIGAGGNGGKGGPSVNRKGSKGDEGQEGAFGTGGGGGGGGGGGSKRNLLFAKSDHAGNGGKGGRGGYGAGGGGGGGGGRSYWNSGNPGASGEAGGYAGSGRYGGAGWDGRGVGCGGGGAGLGGAIFVRSGAVLIRSFDAVFQDNYVAGGRSFDALGGACNSGQGAGSDIFFQDGEGASEQILTIRDNTAPISPTYLTAKNIGEVANQVANNQEIIRQLANFAHALGFAYAGGTNSQYVGDDFEILNIGTSEKPSYTLRFRYNGADPYASGYKADTRLSITLSNFQISIDPTSFKYGTPRSNSITPLNLGTITAVNQGSTTDTFNKAFSYSVAEALQHSTTYKFTEGLKVGFKQAIKFGSAAVLPGETTTEKNLEINFSAEQGWTDSKTTTRTITDTSQYSAPIPARTERTISLVALQTSSSVDYTATAKISFTISYSGFLRAGDNAREDLTTDRPAVTVIINTDQLEGINNSDLSNVTDDTGKRFNPSKLKVNYADYVQNFFKAGIITPLSGTFTNIGGTSVSATVTADKSLDANLPAVLENSTDPVGYKLSSLFGKPIDLVAILSNPSNAAQGVWQYSKNGSDWQNISDGQSLSGDDLLRFLPTANYRGNPDRLKINFDSIDRWISTSVTAIR